MTKDEVEHEVVEALGRLKGFQRDTVEYAFERLYLAPDSTRRFLVADEVGLGKTLVARGVIAKTVLHLWETIGRIDVVYVCSSSSIARQNANRLSPTQLEGFAVSSRLTLLPTQVSDLDAKRVNLIALTPGTSFDLKSSLGLKDERILLYWLLPEDWVQRGSAPYNVLQGDVADWQKFRDQVKAFPKYSRIDQRLQQAFRDALTVEGPGLRARWESVCERFGYAGKQLQNADRQERARLVGDLRSILAKTCARALEPDLVILDEFQRFKHLLAGDEEASLLARELFDYTDQHTETRVLLLSATPYKMFTLHHEAAEDDHYKDFLRTFEFLEPSRERSTRFEHLLGEYRREVYRLAGQSDAVRVTSLKQDIERDLRRVMSRQERLHWDCDGHAMLAEIPRENLRLERQDIEAYVAAQEVAREVGQEQIVEYWKSAPYLLNLMDDYQLKRTVRDTIEALPARHPLAKRLRSSPSHLLSWEDWEGYKEIDPGNARLRSLLRDIDELGLGRLLWLPPSLPYYTTSVDGAGACSPGLTKRLIFSSWMVVPKAIAVLTSYAIERQTMLRMNPEASNTADERKRRRQLLRFSRSDGRLTGMPVLALMYPSVVLARVGDPLRAAASLGSGGRLPTLDESLGSARETLEPLLARLNVRRSEGPPDERWYWAAPILLDAQEHPGSAAWWRQPDLAATWAWEGDDEEGAEPSLWSEHVQEAQLVPTLGPPPADLAAILARLAVGGPAVTALRALSRVAASNEALLETAIRNSAARIGWAFRALFNTPETMALLRATQEEGRYWQTVLDHCCANDLQAVLDEYIHTARHLLGLFERTDSDAFAQLSQTVQAAVSLRTSTMEVDEIKLERGRASIARHHARAHFALRYGSQKSESGAGAAREDQVRTAFNSPFRPFVLATTSVGQEGLDFHPYCHAVVHWNLPANPVDLEQREGRVHRYKGHAVRKNVAAEFGREALATGDSDTWGALFEIARQRTPLSEDGLVPYWLFPRAGGAAIERHVLSLPLSREIGQLRALKRSLAIYRMVFGQPQQDDLLEYLQEHVDPALLERLKNELQIDLSPSVRR